MFALQGLVLIAFIAAGMNWLTTRHSGKLEEEITALQASSKIEIKRQEEIISATQAEIRRISSSPSSTFKLHISATPLSREQALTALNSSLEESRSSEEQYKEKMAARERNLRARQSTMAIVNSGSPLIFSLALFLAAGLFSQGRRESFRAIATRAIWLTIIFTSSPRKAFGPTWCCWDFCLWH